jgi:hypothetical protein
MISHHLIGSCSIWFFIATVVIDHARLGQIHVAVVQETEGWCKEEEQSDDPENQ